MVRRIPQRSGDEGGQALVEFALVLPLLLLILFGVLDFSKAFNYWIDETHLANEAARWAAVNNNPGAGAGQTLQTYTLSQADTNELRNGGTSTVPTKAQLCVSFPNGTSNVGDPVQVNVSVTYNWLPFVGNRIGLTNVNLSSTSTMRLEAKPTNYSAGC
jgi:Flp pilus assembly protein TadG